MNALAMKNKLIYIYQNQKQKRSDDKSSSPVTFSLCLSSNNDADNAWGIAATSSVSSPASLTNSTFVNFYMHEARDGSVVKVSVSGT